MTCKAGLSPQHLMRMLARHPHTPCWLHCPAAGRLPNTHCCRVQAQAQRSAPALDQDCDREERLITLTPQGLDWGDRLALLLPADPPAHWAAAGELGPLPACLAINAGLRPCKT